MQKLDWHCDVLYKLETESGMGFNETSELDVTPERLLNGGVRLQCFALFVSGSQEQPSFTRLMKQISLFHEHVLSNPHFEWVRDREDLEQIIRSGKIGAILTLEGVDALQGNLFYIRHLYQLGVRIIGITWNYANWAADGVLEPRQGTFTLNGRKFVRECEDYGLLLDVSHLCEPAFWELCALTQSPLIATHSNAFAICPHPRNLKDGQIRQIIASNGMIGLTFVPDFLNELNEATRDDVVRHIEHVCALGGVRHIGFGSDFDGVEKWTLGLEHPGKYEEFADYLLNFYKQEEVEGFLWKNGVRFLVENLPLKSI